MKFTRRETFAVAAGFVAFGVAGLRPTTASATEEEAMKAVMEFAGGEPQAGRISLTAPEIAENGNTVPVTVSAPAGWTAVSVATAATVRPAARARTERAVGLTG